VAEVEIRRVPVESAAPTGETNAYRLGSLLVDPAGRADAVDPEAVDHVAVTHTHADHVGGVAAYAGAGATVWARRGRTARFERATGVEPDRTFREGTTIPVDVPDGTVDGGASAVDQPPSGGVTVLDAPGHAVDHVAFVAGDAVVCGDLAVETGSVAVGAPEGDVRAYLTALRRLRARAPDRLLPGHGPAIDDPLATLDRLLAHRRDRERAVERAVRGGAGTLEAVVDAAYRTDVSGVRDLARATVAAHLEKLDVEGRVEWDPGTGAVRPR